MEELQEFSTEDAAFNIKKHFLTKKGQRIRQDYFIFTVYEEEQNLKQLADLSFLHLKRYPLAVLLEKKQKDSSIELTAQEEQKTLPQLFEDLFSWYLSNYKDLNQEEVLDYQHHTHFIHPFILLLLDLNVLYTYKEQEKRFPKITSLPITQEKDPFWHDLSLLFQKHMPNLYDLTWSYILWTHSPVKQKTYQLRDLPPVGRYLQILKKETRLTADKLVSREKEPRTQQPPPPSSAQSGHALEEDELENIALKEVDDAIATLQATIGEGQASLILKPQNSFIRRKQHKKIIDLGFHSASVGEGQERSVQILKQKPNSPSTEN